MSKFPGVQNLTSDLRLKTPELRVAVTRKLYRRRGVGADVG